MIIRGYGESGQRVPKMWRNLSRLRTPKKGQPRAAVLHNNRVRPASPAGPAPFILGLLQAVKFSDTPFDLLRPRDRGVRLNTASFHHFYAAVPNPGFGTFDALISIGSSREKAPR
jgi:hypothetical protein